MYYPQHYFTSVSSLPSNHKVIWIYLFCLVLFLFQYLVHINLPSLGLRQELADEMVVVRDPACSFILVDSSIKHVRNALVL